MKKNLSILICAAMLISCIAVPAFAFTVDPKIQLQHKNGGTNSYSSLSAAVSAAVDGDILTLAGEVSSYSESSGVTISKKITFKTGRDFNGNRKHLQYTGTSESLFTVADGGELTITDSDIYGNSNTSLLYGGLVRVQNGGTLILDGKTGAEVTIQNFRLTVRTSKGGVVYCEQGGKVIVHGVTFTNNFAGKGADIYAEQDTDVTVDSGVTVNAAYGESVDINGLNLVLTGEIGLVFHTVVPDKYLDGTFRLTSTNGETVTYNINDCGQDEDGRYLAKYNLSAIELSEPVTLTVLNADGKPITAKTKTAEEYGQTILASEDATEKEKNVVGTLLNYGHFAQITCAENNGWEIGRDYAATAEYSELTAADSVFDKYACTTSGSDETIKGMNIQLSLDYKTDINLTFTADKEPTVTVNGEGTEVETVGDRYRVVIKGISALRLAKEYTVVINNKLTMKLSALSYCQLTNGQQNENNINAVKALYEFYKSAVAYNKGDVSPDEDHDWGDIHWN